MKRLSLIVLAALSMAFASCSKETVATDSDATAKVYVSVDGFAITQEEFSKDAQSVTDYSGIKAMTLAFYAADGSEQYKVTQLRNAMGDGETFGNYSLSLPMGSYTMVVLAYGLGSAGDDVLALTSPTQAAYTTEHTRETFAATQEVNISSTAAVSLTATLNRIVAKLNVISSDGRPANVASIRMSLAGGSKAFNPTTGLATDNAGYSHTVPLSVAVGSTTNSVSYIFLTADEQNIDLTVEALDAEGNALFTKTITNVPFKRNRATKLTGSMYTNNGISGAFSIETGWEPDYNGTF